MTDELELNGSSVRQEGQWQVTEEEQRSNLRYTNLNKIEINNRKLATVTSGLQKYIYKQLTEQVSR